MLGLREQIRGDGEGVGVLVGDDEDLGRGGQQVKAHLAEDLAPGLGHKGAAGPREELDLPDCLGAHRHGRHGLRPAQDEDLVGAGKVGCSHGSVGASPR